MIGTRLGPYRIEAELGSGGMGAVYRARTAEGEVVAIKVVHDHLLAKPGFFERFRREAALGHRVAHANVVRTFAAAAFEADGRPRHYLVMEYVEGQTLRSLMHELGRAPEELCRHVGRETARALAAIHTAGAVHRDLKPENVLVTRDHVVKVMDLGVARIAEEALKLSQSDQFVGSVHYAAPEQFEREEADARADLYSLGLVLYELATGEHPSRGEDFASTMRLRLEGRPDPPALRNPALSEFFDRVVLTLLARRREDRFDSAGALVEALTGGERSHWWRDSARASGASPRTPRALVPRETRLYGRDAELDRLRGLFARAKAGEGAVALVEGEAGIGKTRLLDELVASLRGAGEEFDFLFGGYPPGGAATPAGAFSTAYLGVLGREGLEETLAEHLAAAPLLVPAFAALLRGEPAPPGTRPLERESIQTAFVLAARSLASRRPLVLAVDDLHFAPDEGRGLFAALALAAPGHRILLVGATRPGPADAWLAGLDRLDHVTRVRLGRLAPADLAHLLVDAFGSKRLARELALRIATKSDGNPFFVFEILRDLRESERIRPRADGGWEQAREIDEIEIPASVAELVRARIAELDDEDRELLELASCCGFRFDPGLVADAAGLAPIPALKRLSRIERRHRLLHAAGPAFEFDHHQVQEALHAALPQPLRQASHLAIAERLVARGGGAAETCAHFLAADAGPRALPFLDAALDEHEGRHRNEAAVELMQRTVDLVEGARRVRLLVRLGTRLDLLGRRDEERATLERALAGARDLGDPALRSRAHRALSAYYLNISDFAQAKEHARRAAELARAHGDRVDEARAQMNVGTALWYGGRFDEALAHHESALALYRDVGDRAGQAIAHGNLGALLSQVGRSDDATAHQQAALDLCVELDDRSGEAHARANLGLDFTRVGRYDDGLEHVQHALRLARQTGYRRLEGNIAGNLGHLFTTLGAYDEARRHFERSLLLERETGYRQGRAFTLIGLSHLSERTGDLASAATHAADALAVAREIGHRVAEVQALAERARIASAAGDLAPATAWLDEALALARTLRHPEELVLCARRALLPGGDVAPALDALARLDPQVAHEQRIEVRFRLYQATGDSDHLAEARRHLEYLRDHAPERYRTSVVADVPLHREIAAAGDAC